jgi:glycerol-3-phosphate dehydrogenase
MPITEKMWEVLHEGKAPAEAMHELMTRSAKSEGGTRI